MAFILRGPFFMNLNDFYKKKVGRLSTPYSFLYQCIIDSTNNENYSMMIILRVEELS
jgi:hypothetical protein